MKTYTEEARQLPISDEVDVIVVGGGPAGIGAALSSARQGMKTLLVEQAGDVGGVATTGLMSHWTGKTSGGLYEEILEASQKEGQKNRQTIDPEYLKTVLLSMLAKANVIVHTYTFACRPIMEANQVKGLIVESKSGREAILCKILIDCSGDGDIAAQAGVPYYKGREEDGKMQPATLMFKVAGVHEEEINFPLPGGFENNPMIPKGPIQDLGKANLESPIGHVLLYKSTIPGVITINMTNALDIDGTNALDLTKAHATCRQQMEPIKNFLREFVPGFEDCYIISSASIVGIRETRHFEGEKTLTAEDILSAKVFDDWVVTHAHFNFDVHNITGAGLDKTGCQAKFPQSKTYTIPYGCLVPKHIDGLLLAGRNISGTHMAHSSYRVMPICVNLGQAAGTAAAIAISNQQKVRDISVAHLQTLLLENGVLPPEC